MFPPAVVKEVCDGGCAQLVELGWVELSTNVDRMSAVEQTAE
jgi:hypothetical protein